MTNYQLHNKNDLQQMVEDYLNGDSLAFEGIYQRYGKAMYHICLRMLGNKEDAEDVLQEAFIKAFTKGKQLSTAANFGAWLKRLVINCCLDILRKTDDPFLSLNENLALEEPDLREDEEPDYTVEEVKLALSQLSNGFRVVLNLYLFEEMSHREIAEQLGISEGTSKSQYNRGKKKLIELIVENKQRNEG